MLILLPAWPSLADYTLTKHGFTLGVGIRAGIGGVATGNTNFGAGTVRPDGSVNGNVAYGEGYLLPRIDLSYAARRAGTFYGAVAGVASGTVGGDPANFTTDSPSAIDLDQLYAGWKSGDLFPGLGTDAIDISVGREYYGINDQEMPVGIGDGFILWDGHLDAGTDGAYWLGPRYAFDMAGIVKFNTNPVGGSLFYLKGNDHQDNSQLAGGNIDYTDPKVGTLGSTYFQIFDSDDSGSFVRDGMNVVSLRALDVPLPVLPALKLSGDFVHEWGDDRGTNIDANGWYASATLDLADLLQWKTDWTPTLTYRYSFFSGDDDPADGSSNAFDPLFYGAPKATWGTWYQGEIVGQYLLFNSNEIAHMVNLNVNPSSAVSTGLFFFDFSLDKPNYFGTPVSDRHFADELDLYVNWSVTDHVYLGVVGALAWPGAAAKEAFGNDDVFGLIESQILITY